MLNGLVYIYFGVMLLLIISGMIVQYKIYKGEDEEKVNSDDIDHKLTNKLWVINNYDKKFFNKLL